MHLHLVSIALGVPLDGAEEIPDLVSLGFGFLVQCRELLELFGILLCLLFSKGLRSLGHLFHESLECADLFGCLLHLHRFLAKVRVLSELAKLHCFAVDALGELCELLQSSFRTVCLEAFDLYVLCCEERSRFIDGSLNICGCFLGGLDRSAGLGQREVLSPHQERQLRIAHFVHCCLNRFSHTVALFFIDVAHDHLTLLLSLLLDILHLLESNLATFEKLLHWLLHCGQSSGQLRLQG
mmetsp:Transcript_56781/g.103830  ORF Transcript_56781/g.103830 Transcript_56781/m.103830 type:complete len:239 (-) Transcript_56781:136-852(-)